jgi:hypothetical protein
MGYHAGSTSLRHRSQLSTYPQKVSSSKRPCELTQACRSDERRFRRGGCVRVNACIAIQRVAQWGEGAFDKQWMQKQMSSVVNQQTKWNPLPIKTKIMVSGYGTSEMMVVGC